jgi:catechol 2,3-dioxygenase-like lactoylglutathione lyase family enzyme
MKQQVHFITLSTRDLDAARAFYRGGLGWTPLLDVPGEIIFFQVAPGMVLGLFDAGKFVADMHGTAADGRLGGLTLSTNVPTPADVDATVRRAVEAGGTLVKPPQTAAFGGYHGHGGSTTPARSTSAWWRRNSPGAGPRAEPLRDGRDGRVVVEVDGLGRDSRAGSAAIAGMPQRGCSRPGGEQLLHTASSTIAILPERAPDRPRLRRVQGVLIT